LRLQGDRIDRRRVHHDVVVLFPAAAIGEEAPAVAHDRSADVALKGAGLVVGPVRFEGIGTVQPRIVEIDPSIAVIVLGRRLGQDSRRGLLRLGELGGKRIRIDPHALDDVLGRQPLRQRQAIDVEGTRSNRVPVVAASEP
jgi:hypothetical protein